jgi:hypothetical protein
LPAIYVQFQPNSPGRLEVSIQKVCIAGAGMRAGADYADDAL